MGAFVLDPDVIKAELPEYKESHSAGADGAPYVDSADEELAPAA